MAKTAAFGATHTAVMQPAHVS